MVCSDGDLMEGVSAEAASLAGNLPLGKLIAFYDDNHITIEGSTDLAFCERVGTRFEAYGWHVARAGDVNDLAGLEAAVTAAVAEEQRPSLLIVESEIGYGAPNKAGTAAAHGAPLGAEEARKAKRNLGWPYEEPFVVPVEVRQLYEAEVLEIGQTLHAAWRDRFAAYEHDHSVLAREFLRVMRGALPPGWDESLPPFAEDMATRTASGRVLNTLASRLPELVGGSADLAPSTDTYLDGSGDVSCRDFGGRNFHFGVREHAMGSVLNGMAAHGGLRPFGATFLVFSDYMRPAIRLAAMMRLPVVYVFTHDSIGLGEDGPTHQPIEHLASLRAIPGLVVLRPADANETAAAWRTAARPARRAHRAGARPARRFRPCRRRPRARWPAARTSVLTVTTSPWSRRDRRCTWPWPRGTVSPRRTSPPAWCRCRRGSSSTISRPPTATRCSHPGSRASGLKPAAARVGAGTPTTSSPSSRSVRRLPPPDLFEAYGLTPDSVARRAQSLLERTGYRAIRSGGPT